MSTTIPGPPIEGLRVNDWVYMKDRDEIGKIIQRISTSVLVSLNGKKYGKKYKYKPKSISIGDNNVKDLVKCNSQLEARVMKEENRSIFDKIKNWFK